MWKQQRKAGLTTQDFKTWLTTAKAKNFSNVTGESAIPVNTTLNDSIQSAINDLHQEGGLQTTAGSQYTFGISNTLLLWSGVGVGLLITGFIIYKISHRK